MAGSRFTVLLAAVVLAASFVALGAGPSLTAPAFAQTVGSSVGFSGDDAVSVPNDVSLQIAGDLSYELWLKPDAFSTRQNPIAKAYSGEGTITQETNGRLVFYHGSGGGDTSGYEAFDTASSLSAGVWSHVVVVREGTTVSWYINGALNRVHAASVTPSVSSLPLLIGDGYTNGYDGNIDEVAVYDRALTPTEVSDHFNALVADDHTAYGALVTGDNPVSYFRLDETAGTLAVDTIGANHGVYQGTPTLGDPGASAEGVAVSVTSPTVGATVSGLVDLEASTSGAGVLGVQFKVDGVGVGGEDAAPPYRIDWDSTAVSDGSHDITAVARTASASVTSDPVSITVDNVADPIVAVTVPSAGATVSSSVTLEALITGNGVLGVQFRVDGAEVGAEDTSEPFSVPWDSTLVPDGSHDVDAVARTATGTIFSGPISITVDNTAPVITLLGEEPQTITQNDPYVELGATATDDPGGVDVSGDIVIDASNVTTSVVGNYQVSYNVTDAAGNAAVEETRTVIVEPAGGLGEVVSISAGIHYGYSVVPADNTTYQCEPGAILDGQNSTQYAFIGNADHVSIIGCEIRNYDNPAQYGAINGSSGADDWLVRDNIIHHNWGVGIFISGARPIVVNNHIHHQHQLGVALNHSVDGLVEGNEINHNNWQVDYEWGWEAGGSKFWANQDLTVRNNHVHDNHGPGLWTDTDNAGILYEDNLVEDNCANGIMHEVSFDAVIRNNTLNRNGSCHAVWYWGPGILISASPDVEVYGNMLNDNYNGITVVNQCRYDGGFLREAVGNSAHDNVINNSGISGAISDCGGPVELEWSNNTLTGSSVHADG